MAEIKAYLTLFLVLLPFVIALLRGHRNALAISVLNGVAIAALFFFGAVPTIAFVAAIIPWIVALVWSCTDNTRRAHRRSVPQVRIEPY